MILAEIVAATDAAGTTTTLRFGTAAHTTTPSETPASVFFDPRIKPLSSISRAMWGGGSYGQSKIGIGDIQLSNADGALDAIKDYGFDGRALTLRLGEPGAAYPAGLPIVFKGTIEQAEFTWGQASFRLRDRLFELAKPLLQNRYGGTNVLPAGLDGGAQDSKGKPKPRIYGKVYNISPPLVNTSLLTYQVSDAAITTVDAVYDRGAALTAGGERRLATLGIASVTRTFTTPASGSTLTTSPAHGYTTGDPVTVATTGTLPAPLNTTTTYFARVLAASTVSMHTTRAAAIAGTGAIVYTTAGTGVHNISNTRTLAGSFDWSSNATGSYLVLGSTPSGALTADVTGSSAANSTCAQILEQIALDMGIAAGDISAADVTALDTATTAVLGIYCDDTANALDAMDQIAASVGAWYGFDRLGVLRMGRLVAPGGSPAATLTTTEIIDGRIERIANPDAGRGLPQWRVTVQHSRNYTPQPSDLAGSVTALRRAYLALGYRASQAEDATIKTQYLLAPELARSTLLTTEAAAAAEAARLLALYKVKRETYQATVRLDATLAQSLDLGAVVALQIPRFGLAAGKNMVVLAIDADYALNTLTLTLWG